jgi:CheY-like chemotaxis protein
MAPVLVVDDSAEAREAVRALLELDGYPVTEAADGREALEMLVGDCRNQPCLIVLDLEMPLMTGWELLSVLQTYHRLAAIPVLVVSAYDRGSVPQTASLAGYFQKPYAARQLLRKVRECARRVGSQPPG